MTKKVKKPASVVKSKYFLEIVDCVKSGWSPPAIERWLRNRYQDDPEIPSCRSIERWRKKSMSEAVVIPHQIIRDKLKGVDYRVDLLKELSQFIPLLADRIAASLEVEKSMLGGLASPQTDRAVETYLQVLKEYRETAQDLGELPPPRTQPLVNVQLDSRKVVIENEGDLVALVERMRSQDGIRDRQENTSALLSEGPQ